MRTHVIVLSWPQDLKERNMRAFKVNRENDISRKSMANAKLV